MLLWFSLGSQFVHTNVKFRFTWTKSPDFPHFLIYLGKKSRFHTFFRFTMGQISHNFSIYLYYFSLLLIRFRFAFYEISIYFHSRFRFTFTVRFEFTFHHAQRLSPKISNSEVNHEKYHIKCSTSIRTRFSFS